MFELVFVCNMFELVFLGYVSVGVCVLYLSWYLCVSAGPAAGWKDKRELNKKEKSSRLEEISKE